MNTDKHRWDQLTELVLKCAYRVSNELGCGFLEKAYENALVHELTNVADLVVETTALVELKAVRAFDEVHFAQCLNYLRATGSPVCLLINFAKPRLEVKRFAGPAAITV